MGGTTGEGFFEAAVRDTGPSELDVVALHGPHPRLLLGGLEELPVKGEVLHQREGRAAVEVGHEVGGPRHLPGVLPEFGA